MTKDYFEKTAGLAAEEIARTVKARMMCDTLKAAGWHEVKIPNMNDVKSRWISRNLKKAMRGNYYGYHDTWVFELEEDATYFYMKWL